MEPSETDHLDLDISSLEPDKPGRSGAAPAWRWRRSRPGRVTISVICGVLVVSALAAMLFRSTTNPSSAISALLNISTPTATEPVPNDADAFFITHSVPWGKLTVDGASPAYSNILSLGPGFRLPRGAHHLEYQARFFPTVRCLVSVPQATRDTCALGDTAPYAGITFERILDLQATPQRLQSAQYNALAAAVIDQLSHISATDTIQPGERYYTKTSQLAVARAPMKFTVGLTPSPTTLNNCLFLCTTDVGLIYSQDSWQLQALVTGSWAVTDSSGTKTPSSIPGMPYDPTPLPLSVGNDGAGWTIQIEDPSPLQSVVASGALQAFANLVSGEASHSINGENAGAAANPAEGAYVLSTTTISGGSAGPLLIFFWRCGVLLAVNPLAAKIFPKLPVATPYEQQIALATAKQAMG